MYSPQGCLEEMECAPAVGPYLILLQSLWGLALQRDSWTSLLPASALWAKLQSGLDLPFYHLPVTLYTLLLPPGCSKLILGEAVCYSLQADSLFTDALSQESF